MDNKLFIKFGMLNDMPSDANNNSNMLLALKIFPKTMKHVTKIKI